MAMPEPAAGYTGVQYTKASDVTDAWFAKFQDSLMKGEILPKKDAYLMLLDWIDLLRDPVKTTTVVDVRVGPGQELTIFGDLHGQFFDFHTMMKSAGMPSPQRAEASYARFGVLQPRQSRDA